jgi:hypothetical protein
LVKDDDDPEEHGDACTFTDSCRKHSETRCDVSHIHPAADIMNRDGLHSD